MYRYQTLVCLHGPSLELGIFIELISIIMESNIIYQL